MIRQKMIQKRVSRKNDFRWRSKDVHRIEGFTDAVFAFALTLLVVSLEVPKTFNDLLMTIKGFTVFAICFALLAFVWYEHYKYFRRYGLNDALTVTLNLVLLFVVLFYVYPLKFLFSLFVGALTGFASHEDLAPALPGNGQLQQLFAIYGAGYFAVFLLFVILYYHALRKKEELSFTKIEIFDTKTSLYGHMVHVSIAALSILIALVGGNHYAEWAGWVYFLLGPAFAIHGTMRGKLRKQIFTA